MKTLKFRKSLNEEILKGQKRTTWRLFDDKDLSTGDTVSFLIRENKEEFAKAELVDVQEKTFGELTEQDRECHEKFSSDTEMYQTYSKYYNCQVDENTSLKIIKFRLL